MNTPTIITCAEYTGLGVLYSVDITIEYTVMKGCGKNHQLSIAYNDIDFLNYADVSVTMYVALYFDKHYKIMLDSVVIQESKAIGLYIGDGEYYVPSDFIMNNCLIVDGLAAESSQNSISGGIVINTYYSTVHLSNTSIVNNGDGTQSRDVYCSPIGTVAGIVVIKSPAEF